MVRSLGTLAIVALVSACSKPVEDVDRTQPNALHKSLFAGEWYFARTVIDAPYEVSGTFIGDRQEYLFQEDFPAYKIRWRLEENNLIACRADEIVVGSNSPGRTEGDEVADPSKAEARAASDQGAKFPCEHPLAAFGIKHFDILRQYNPATGEQSNVLSENTSDRHWYEREYIRVDWTDQNVADLNFSIWAQRDLGWLGIDNAYYVQEETSDCAIEREDGPTDYSGCPEGFLPPLVADDNIMITNRMTMVPDGGLFSCFITSYYGYGQACTLSEIGVRYSFMKVPERTLEEQYEPATWPDEKFERFGIWRVTKPTFEPGRGETDFKQYLGTKWHIWERTQTCDGDNNCTPIPLRDRTLKPIVYHLNRQFPQDLKPAAFSLSKEWNDAFNGILPGTDLTETCQIRCAGGKSASECSATDENWRMEGTCAFELRENDGSQFLGDLRYNYIAYIEDASPNNPCGVGGPANDPETGELVNAVSYVYGAGCFDYIENRVLDMVDILCAQHRREGENELPRACQDIDENQFLRGLRVLEIMSAQGYVQPPATPIRRLAPGEYDFSNQGADSPVALVELKQRMDELQNHTGMLHHNAAKLRGTGIERAMIPDEIAIAISGGLARNASELSDEEVARFNPLNPTKGGMNRLQDRIDQLAARAVEPADYLFNDAALWSFARNHLDKDRDAFAQIVREQAFRAVTLHELGHNMGLRHNFISSFDRANFFPEYWNIRQDVEARFEEETGRPLPAFSPDLERDEEGDEFYERFQAWDSDRRLLRRMLDDAGIRQYRYSSIMDYHAELYNDWNGLGAYDKAAMRFIYADLVDRVDCFENDVDRCGLDGRLEPSEREHATWYLGGELCDSDGDCPATAEGQRCDRSHPAAADLGIRLCSNWDIDERRPVEGRTRFNVRHKFCSDDRVADRPFCNRFDEGESSEEIVRNMIQAYEKNFVFNNFRRYRTSFYSPWQYFQRIFRRYFIVVGDQMQSLLYKYFYEPGFTSNEGPGGFDDMFRATVVGFDFIGNVLALPEAGSHEWSEQEQVYIHDDTALVENPTADNINVPLGMGKTLYSSWERGYFGEANRMAYAGVLYDKLAALLTLTLRDWGSSNLGNDERFRLNYYDYFRNAYIDILGSFVSGETAQAGNLFDLDNQTLVQRTWWDGTFRIFGWDEGFDGASLSPANARKIEPGASTILGVWALLYGALNTSYYLDISFTSSMRLFEVGGNTGFDISHIDEDNIVDCISPLTHRRFAAVQTSIQPSIAARSLVRCRSLVDRYMTLDEALKTGAELPDGMSRNEAEREHTRLEYRISSQEDRLSNMVYIYDVLGVGSL